MTPEINAGIILGVMIAFAFYFFVQSVRVIANHIRIIKAAKNAPSAIPAKDICSSHSYDEVTLALRKVRPGLHMVCKKCGFIAGTDFKLSAPGLSSYQEYLKIKAATRHKREIVRHRIQFDLECARDKWIIENGETIASQPEKTHTLLKDFFTYAIATNEAVRLQVTDEINKGQFEWGE